MKLKVFYASDGDCLLLTSSDGRHTLIDGGRTTTFREQTWPLLLELADAEEQIDLVVVSHIDADHISGILWLAKVLTAWEVHDYQVGDGGNPDLPEPRTPRPPPIGKLWHNAWGDQVGDLAGPIQALADRVADGLVTSSGDPLAAPELEPVIDALQELATSIPDGVELIQLIDDGTPLVRNEPFDDLVLLTDPPHVEKLGKTRLTVIGPSVKHLERLREEWRSWLEAAAGGQGVEGAIGAPRARATTPDLGVATGPIDFGDARDIQLASGQQLATALANAAKIIATTDPTKVTPPNRASVTLLAEENKRTCLLTGDAAEEELLEGLEAAGRLRDDRFWCNVVKVQHHGSEYNLSQQFASRVLAEQYVFCADGAHSNPDPSVVKTLVETRADADDRPFTIWFNCSPERTLESRRKKLRAAIREAEKAADGNDQIAVNVLDDDQPYLEITV